MTRTAHKASKQQVRIERCPHGYEVTNTIYRTSNHCYNVECRANAPSGSEPKKGA